MRKNNKFEFINKKMKGIQIKEHKDPSFYKMKL